MSLRETLAAGALVLGSAVMLLAALGVVRLPDVYTRMSAASKASTLGAGLLALGAALAFPAEPVAAQAVALVAFLALAAPVASHLVGRAAYVSGTRPWQGTARDDLAGRYDHDRGTLAGAAAGTGGAAGEGAAGEGAPGGPRAAGAQRDAPGRGGGPRVA
jgi:multicomponent Na+:H+ antiporter subunit G